MIDKNGLLMRLTATATFALLVWVNLVNFCDRGIIPGSFQEFSDFVANSSDSFGASPSTQLGFLQSAFIIGLIVGFAGFGHAVHHVKNVFSLTGIGCTVWVCAVMLSGISYYTNSFVCLLIARMLSGFGEASLQCTIPPWIQACAPPANRGVWLALFFTAIPVGTATGYAYSSSMSASMGWQWAYFLEAVVAAPFVLALFLLEDHSGTGGAATAAAAPAAGAAGSTELTHMSFEGSVHNPLDTEEMADSPLPRAPEEVPKQAQTVSWEEEFRAVIYRPVYLCIVAGYAAQVAVLIGISTFGSAFIMGLGYYDSETEASSIFGVLASFSGIVGTPLGGFVLDVLARRAAAHPAAILSDQSDGQAAEEARLMDHICVLIYWTSLLGMLVLCMCYFALSAGLFFTIITLGCMFLFMTAGAVNMAIMMSVPAKHRAFGIALASICGHVFGDVPSPAVAGFLKDTLAPDCAEDSASDACREEAPGLRWCMLLLTLWLYLSVLFFALAWQYNQKQLARYHRNW